MIRTSFKTSLRCSAALAVTLAAGFGQAAFAQQTQLAAAAATEASVDEIVVTGTRVVRDGYEAPTPVSVIGVEEIEDAATAT